MSNLIPLHLCQVLEEEYINLHGQLDPHPGWYFKSNHFKSGDKGLKQAEIEAIKAKLSNSSTELAKFLRKNFLNQGELQDPDHQTFIKGLNKSLEAINLYSPVHFPDESLSDELVGLVEIGVRKGWTSKAQVVFHGDELVRFNRLLLESAFPDEIKSIYDLRLKNIYTQFHRRDSSAVCLSGGGIRSATFSLGVIQGLACHGLLKNFNYISTVSGGGYLGGWLSTWINRHPRGLDGVTEALASNSPDAMIEPEAAPLTYLRNYSNFLTPKCGLLSADVWAFVATIVRNLLLNWTVIIPLLMALLLVPRIGLGVVQETPPDYLRWLMLAAGLALTGYAIAYASASRPSVADAIRPGSYYHGQTGQEGFLKHCLTPLIFAAFSLAAFWAWYRNASPSVTFESQLDQAISKEWPEWIRFDLWPFFIFGAAAHILGWLIYSFLLRRFKIKELVAAFITGLVGGGLLWLMVTKIFGTPVFTFLGKDNGIYLNYRTAIYTCFSVPTYLVTFFLAITFFVGSRSRARQRAHSKEPADRSQTRLFWIQDEDREWFARFGGWLLVVVVGWALFTSIVIFGPFALLRLPYLLTSIGGVTGILTILGGRSSHTPASSEKGSREGWKSLIASNALTVTGLVFMLLLTSSVSLLVCQVIRWLSTKSWFGWFFEQMSVVTVFKSAHSILAHLQHPILGTSDWRVGQWHLLTNMYYAPWWLTFLLCLTSLAIGMWMAYKINLNVFSLHAAYRNRLIRAFLGASRDERIRRPNPFTGFDPADDTPMHELRPGLLTETSFSDEQRLAKFVGELRRELDGAEPKATSHLVGLLSPTTRDQIKDHHGEIALSSSLKANLITDLNRVLEKKLLYQLKPFSELDITKSVISQIDELRTSLGLQSDEEASQLPIEVRNNLVATVLKKIEESGQPLRYRTIAEGIVSQSIRGDYTLLINRMLFDLAYNQYVREMQYPPPLLHIVNTALNLVGGDKLAWQQRKAEPFSVSPLHCGSLFVGYRRSREYGGRNGIALGTAAAISGAAASSNSGYYSTSPLITFLLTFFNARLGWWLGNPGAAGSHPLSANATPYYQLGYPNSAIYPIFREAFGLTDDKDSYVLLSDGGHFENLALYEMVLRRCKTIVVVDGGQDAGGQFSDLGNAVRKIRIDLGIPIIFESIPIYPRLNGEPGKVQSGKYCAIGRIKYSSIDRDANDKPVDDGMDGILIYLKPAFYGNEPPDIYNYAQTNKAFPHETTADQWFDEPQFESHRILGRYVMDQICGSKGTLTLGDFVCKAHRHCRDSERPLKWLEERCGDRQGREVLLPDSDY